VTPPYTLLEHPSDIGIEATGSTLAEAFQAAAQALVSIILQPESIELSESREITVTGQDKDQLLVKWLSEILYLYDGKGFAAGEFKIHRLSGNQLKATVRGEMFSAVKHSARVDVKAVTYHQLCIQEGSKAALVRVYLDI
jgi:SHS2 domain-containing protein